LYVTDIVQLHIMNTVFSDHKAHLKSSDFLKDRKCAL